MTLYGAHRIYEPDDVTDVGTSLMVPLGTIRQTEDTTYGTKKYKYVQFVNAVASVVGDLVTYISGESDLVTNDLTGGASGEGSVNRGAGILISTPAEDDYCWIQGIGRCDTVKGDGSVTAGSRFVPDTTNGRAKDATVGTDGELTCGIALEADGGTPVHFAALLEFPGY